MICVNSKRRYPIVGVRMQIDETGGHQFATRVPHAGCRIDIQLLLDGGNPAIGHGYIKLTV